MSTTDPKSTAVNDDATAAAEDTVPTPEAAAQVAAAPPVPASPTRKELYDLHIAPHLQAIMQACTDHAIGFVVAFDLDDAPTDVTKPAHVAHAAGLGEHTATQIHYAALALDPPQGMCMVPMRRPPSRGLGAFNGKSS